MRQNLLASCQNLNSEHVDCTAYTEWCVRCAWVCTACSRRDAYTNTIETERLRETLRKEHKVVARNMKIEMEKTSRRLSRPETPEEIAVRLRVSSRKYRPTSASAIGINLDRAALLNPQSYGKPMEGFPTSYECKHAHRPVLISDGAPGFYRKSAGPSPVMWGGMKGDGRLAQMDSRTF